MSITVLILTSKLNQNYYSLSLVEKLKLQETSLISHNCESVSWWRTHWILPCCLSALTFLGIFCLLMEFWCVINRTFCQSHSIPQVSHYEMWFLSRHVKRIPKQAVFMNWVGGLSQAILLRLGTMQKAQALPTAVEIRWL